MSNNKKEAPLQSCMIVQQFDRRYYNGWTDDELKAVDEAKDNNDIAPLLNVIGLRLYRDGIVYTEMHGIIHNKDTISVWDESSHNYVTKPKEPHFHIVVKIDKNKSAKRTTLPNIAKSLGLTEQSIEKPKPGKCAYENMVAYLIHIKYEDKYQYDPNEVKTINLQENGKPMGKTFMEIYSIYREQWIKARAKIKKEQAKIEIDTLEEMILNGEVTKSQVILTDKLYLTYSRFNRRCDDAFNVYGERRAYKTLQALEEGLFKLTVLFIMGESGSGKTRSAKEFILKLINKFLELTGERWRVCQTAASNPMDEYNGEEILFMDDIRGSALTASDWLKLLDPYNISPAGARYHNKTPACRVVVITSTKEPIEFFYYCRQTGNQNAGSEAMDQFIRRIQSLTRVIKASDFKDARAEIGECVACDSYATTIPNSRDEQTILNYRFDFDKKEYSIDEVTDKMVELVVKNNKTSED